MMTRRIRQRAFTIVELLIVIVIIAVIATIALVSFSAVQERAATTAISDQIKKTEKGMHLLAAIKGWSTWPDDSTVVSGVTEDPKFIELRAIDGDYTRYLPDLAKFGGISRDSWGYDADTEETIARTACGYRYNGVSIHVAGVSQSRADTIDKAMDDGNNNCGKVRYDSAASRLIYTIDDDFKI